MAVYLANKNIYTLFLFTSLFFNSIKTTHGQMKIIHLPDLITLKKNNAINVGIPLLEKYDLAHTFK